MCTLRLHQEPFARAVYSFNFFSNLYLFFISLHHHHNYRQWNVTTTATTYYGHKLRCEADTLDKDIIAGTTLCRLQGEQKKPRRPNSWHKRVDSVKEHSSRNSRRQNVIMPPTLLQRKHETHLWQVQVQTEGVNRTPVIWLSVKNRWSIITVNNWLERGRPCSTTESVVPEAVIEDHNIGCVF